MNSGCAGTETVDPVVEQFLATRRHEAAIGTLSFGDAHRALRRIQAVPVEMPDMELETLSLPVGPTGSVPVRILRPPLANGRPLPFILYLHGGCWVMGGADTHDRLARLLALGSEAAVVAVDYALAPAAQYPVQIEQAHAALAHLAAQAATHRLDASRIAIAGDCAGGTIAAAVAMLCKRRRGPDLVLQLLFDPLLAEPEDGCDGWPGTAAMRRWIAAAFPDPAIRLQPTAFPIHATEEDLNDLPPALIIQAEHDPLRAAGEAYAARLQAAGVPARTACFPGMIHDFVALHALADAPATQAAITEATAALRAALYGP